jgi:hypothetical protein
LKGVVVVVVVVVAEIKKAQRNMSERLKSLIAPVLWTTIKCSRY